MLNAEGQVRREGNQATGAGVVLVSAPLADAELLAVPDRLDGAGAALRDLPGALHALPGEPRTGEDVRAQGLGLRRRRRDGRARVAGGAVARRARGARQPGLRRQLQPAAARRPGARQRLDHPGARRALRRRRLERDQAAVGQRLGPAVRARHAHAAAARLHETVDGEFQTTVRHRRPLQPRALLQQVSGAARSSPRTCPTTTSTGCGAAATTR